MYQTSLFRRHSVCKQAQIDLAETVEKRCTRIWNIVSYIGSIYNMTRRQQLVLSTECVLYSYEIQCKSSPYSYDEIHQMISDIELDEEKKVTCCF